MTDNLEDLRDALSRTLDQLLAERDAAVAKNDEAKAAVAEAEADRVGVVLATVQFAIDKAQALNMVAVTRRLLESIEAQRAVGLLTARRTLERLVRRIAPPEEAPSEPTKPRRGREGAAGREGGTGREGGPKRNRKPGATKVDIEGKPGKHKAIVDAIIAAAKKHDLEPMDVLTIVAIESDFDPAAASKLSSAAGLFQFIDSTWLEAGGTRFQGLGGRGNGFAAGASVDVQCEIGCKFIVKNRSDLESKLKSPPTLTATYMAHQQGLGGALKLLKADPSAAVESVIGQEAARNNAFGGLTVAQTIAKFNTLVRSNEDQARALVTMTEAEARPVRSAAVTPRDTAIGREAPGSRENATTSSIAQKAAHVALTEMEMFARRENRIIRETENPLSLRVLEYFSLVGRPDIRDPSAEPWSAAFISFVMRSAGADASEFPISPHHARYILTALRHRMSNRLDAPIVYFDRDEMAPRPGDLVGFSRTARVKNRADIEAFLPDKFFPSHTDLVIDVSPGRVTAIGGNVSQTIKTSSIKTDGGGKIDPASNHFFVLRVNL